MKTKSAQPSASKDTAKQSDPGFLLPDILQKHEKIVIPLFLLLLTTIFYWPVLSCSGFFWNDFPEQNFPNRLFSAVALKNGTLPFWNPYVFGGMPFLADVQAAFFYPLNLLLVLFASPDWLSPIVVEYQVILHVFIAGISMYWLCKSLGCSKPGSLMGAITFMFCGFLTTHIFHLNLIHTAAWFPLLILLCKLVLDKGSILFASCFALLFGSVVLAGYPQLVLHMSIWLLAFAFFVLVRFRKNDKCGVALFKRLVLFSAMIAIGGGIASIQLIPTNELGLASARPTLDYRQSCEGSLRPYRLITAIVPKYFGIAPRDSRDYQNASPYWGVSPKDANSGSHYYWETAIYCGILPIFLALFLLFFVRTPMTLFLGGSALLALLLSMGDSFFLYHLAYSYVPGFNRFRVPARFAMIYSTSIALLAGMGLDYFCRTASSASPKKRRLFTIFIAVAGGLALIWIITLSSGAIKESIRIFCSESGIFGTDMTTLSQYIDERIFPNIINQSWLAFLLVCASLVFLVYCIRFSASSRNKSYLALGLLFFDMLVFGYGFSASNVDPRATYAKTPLVQQFQTLLRSDYFRINSRSSRPGTDDLGGREMFFQKNQGSVHRLFLTEGYNPLRLKRQLANRKTTTLDILNVRYMIDATSNPGTMGIAINPTAFPRTRMFYDYLVQPDEALILPTLYSESFDYRRKLLLETDPNILKSPQLDSSMIGRSSITSYRLNRIDMAVTTALPGILLLSEIHYPDWHAFVDDKPVQLLRADYALRAIPVPAGTHTVSCVYQSKAFSNGLVLSLIALLIALSGLGIGLKKRQFNQLICR